MTDPLVEKALADISFYKKGIKESVLRGILTDIIAEAEARGIEKGEKNMDAVIAEADERGKTVPCPEPYCVTRDVTGPPCPTCHGEGHIRRELAGALWMVGRAEHFFKDVLGSGVLLTIPGLLEQAHEKYGNATD